jgi:ubiquinone/menaquinone biosynthesis C-methylase UbiE
MDDQTRGEKVKRIVQLGYDQIAHEYARLEGEFEWPRMKWLKKLLPQLKPGSDVLDLGCGSGDPADIEISKSHSVTGVDISKAQIQLARKNIPNANFILADAGSIKFPEKSFDAVVSFYTIEHIPRKEHLTILERIHQWLKPQGYLLISLEAGEYDDEIAQWLGVPMFISCYDPETMKQMVAKAGFMIIETAIETQFENKTKIPFLWIFAQKV